MNMIRSAKNQIAELTAAAYRAAVQIGRASCRERV